MTVTIEGTTQLRAALRRFAPDLARELQRELTAAANEVAAAARQLIPPAPPLSGMGRAWQGDRLRWDSARARAGIKGTTARGRARDGVTAVVVIKQNDPAGSVFEVAGRGGGGRLGAQLTRRWGPASRAGWRAADRMRPQIVARVDTAARRASADLAARIAAGGGGAP